MKTILSLLLICHCAVASHAIDYSVQNLGSMYPCAINNSGQVVGKMLGADGSPHAFLWQNGNTQDLGVGWGQDINDQGQVLIRQLDGSSAIWQDQKTTTVPALDAIAINDSGQIAGWSSPAGTAGGWIWQGGDVTYLDGLRVLDFGPNALNKWGQVLAYSVTASGLTDSWFVWQDGIASPIEGLLYGATPVAINDNGQITGEAMVTNNPDPEHYYACQQAWLWDGETTTVLGALGISDGRTSLSSPWGMNNRGQIVGRSFVSTDDTWDADPNVPQHAFVWKNGVMTDLGSSIAGDSQAFGINDNGWIIGSAYADGQFHGYLWMPVPEPASLLALAAGLAMLAGLRQWRVRQE